MQTIRVRRSRPSIPALALALMITMLFVYAISLSAKPQPEASDAAAATTSMDVHLPGMETAFIVCSRSQDALQARILAAQCAQHGGAGLILADGSDHAIVHDAGSEPAGEDILRRTAVGLTMKISGSSAEIAAISNAVDFLRAQATETGALAEALETGDTNAASIRSLLEIYRTRAQRCSSALGSIPQHAVPLRLQAAVDACLQQLETAIAETNPGSLRLVHAAACAQWLGLLEELSGEGDVKGAPPL